MVLADDGYQVTGESSPEHRRYTPVGPHGGSLWGPLTVSKLSSSPPPTVGLRYGRRLYQQGGKEKGRRRSRLWMLRPCAFSVTAVFLVLLYKIDTIGLSSSAKPLFFSPLLKGSKLIYLLTNLEKGDLVNCRNTNYFRRRDRKWRSHLQKWQ